MLYVLARSADDLGWVRGGEYLSTKTGLSRNPISRVIAELEEHQRIVVFRKRGRANLYKFREEASSELPRAKEGGR